MLMKKVTFNAVCPHKQGGLFFMWVSARSIVCYRLKTDQQLRHQMLSNVYFTFLQSRNVNPFKMHQCDIVSDIGPKIDYTAGSGV